MRNVVVGVCRNVQVDKLSCQNQRQNLKQNFDKRRQVSKMHEKRDGGQTQNPREEYTQLHTSFHRRCDQTATNDSATVTVKMTYSGRPQIQPGQFPADLCEISRTLFKQKYSTFVRDKPYNIRMQVEVCNVDK